ncbi:hypothetical protein TWF718_009665 [Orbilia javanica]|uniref:Uncharacterized protein n=1 Tax=Orbilia javanica TaxID=47235 RepID=A0AAN8MTL3_9PEZI
MDVDSNASTLYELESEHKGSQSVADLDNSEDFSSPKDFGDFKDFNGLEKSDSADNSFNIVYDIDEFKLVMALD